MNRLKTFLNDESGQNLVEYALIAGLIGLGALACLRGLSGSTNNGLVTIGNRLTSST